MAIRCNMDHKCNRPVTYIDTEGYVYCTPCGLHRQYSHRCRKLAAWELRELQAGVAIRYERTTYREHLKRMPQGRRLQA